MAKGRKTKPVPREAHEIVVHGAREHNLKDVTLRIPRDKMVVVTGLSGSGKSSLAFDTIYVEGQRRYVESLSAYARQFLEMTEKPDVEQITGLPPTIAIQQRRSHHNPRSTVATITEIYDYLRLLFARAGFPHCWKCGKPITRQTPQQIVDAILPQAMGKRLILLAPVVRGRKGGHKEVLQMLRREGYVRARIDGDMEEVRELKEVENKRRKHTIEAVIDRLKVKDDSATRLAESVEAALDLAEGNLVASIETEDGWVDRAFSDRYACIDCDLSMPDLEPRMFSFNSPYGACPACDGLGTKLELDPELLIPNPSLSLSEGGVEALRKAGKRLAIYYHQMIRGFAQAYGVSMTTPINELPKKVVNTLLYGDTKANGFEGLIPNLMARFHKTDSDFVKHKILDYMAEQPCTNCKGARLRPEVLAVQVGGVNIHQYASLTVERALEFMEQLELDPEREGIAAPIRREVLRRLTFMRDVGLDYLTLDRMAGTLSGGEAQRIRLASQVGSGLVGVCYVLDEPTIGLHQRDNDRLLATLLKMRDLGNTVIVVEHDEDVMRAADHIVDMGPGAGPLGGRVIAEGTLEEIEKDPNSLTGAYLSGELTIEIPEERRPASARRKCLRLQGCSGNNLKNINVTFPMRTLTCVTGVSGSGKSTLINETLYKALGRALHRSREKPMAYKRLAGVEEVDKIINIDQSPIGKTPRSNPATYTGIFDEIRRLFALVAEAKIRGYTPSRFSFNVKGGRCEHCQGAGLIRVEMHFLPDVFVTCEHCKGLRYNRETLEIRYKGKSIADVLEMSISEACHFFKNVPKIRDGLVTLADVGLGYVALGQNSTTLSGGESQRVKLASELSKRATGNTIYILDEPTTGLHFADIKKLLTVLERLVNRGNTVIVIEHNLDVIKCADWIVDLGPEGGERGGELIFAGRPEEIVKCKESHTGQYLKRFLKTGHAR